MEGKKLKNKQGGITLIALVVTIVVLLILAGVSINLVLGNNGLINKAKEAKEKIETAQIVEDLNMKMLEEEIGLYSNDSSESNMINNLGIVGLEKVEFDKNDDIIFNYIIERDGTYYKASINGDNEILSVEKTDKLSDESVAFWKYIDYDLEVENVLYEQFRYKDILYTICYNEVSADTEEMYVQKDRTSMVIKVNSGEDGVVSLPMDRGLCTIDYHIDWGDGKINDDNTIVNSNSGMPHTYSEKNKEYSVTIVGSLRTISTSIYSNSTREKIIEISQWGETGLEKIELSDCINLKKIASPTEKSFNKVTSFNSTFSNCEGLQEIPEDLFNSCPYVTNFSGTFFHCTSLQNIPEGLFDNCSYVTDFNYTFQGCTNLTGNAPKLWERVQNGAENDYYGTPKGKGCFENCTNLNNYEEIPDFWKIVNVE